MRHQRTRSTIRGTSPEIVRMAGELRRDMTPAELRLWEALRGKQLDGMRFRAQHPVGRFILDFYCPAAKLVVEVDGAIHDANVERDEERFAYLAAYAYKVVRVRNEQVYQDLPSVLDKIRNAVLQRPPEDAR